VTAKKAATTEELSDLHKRVAESLVEDLNIQAPAIEDGDDTDVKREKLALMELSIKARHDARAHAITFLKNNNITAAQGNAEMSALKAALANRKQPPLPARGIPQHALDEAAELYGKTVQ
jgi:hypothetical protein